MMLIPTEDDDNRRIVRCWSELDIRELPRDPVAIAAWLGLAVGDVERRMRALARLEQLPGYFDE